MHSPRVVLEFSDAKTQPPDLSDDQDHEDDAGDTHEHSDTPQDIGDRRAHSKGTRSEPLDGDSSLLIAAAPENRGQVGDPRACHGDGLTGVDQRPTPIRVFAVLGAHPHARVVRAAGGVVRGSGALR